MFDEKAQLVYSTGRFLYEFLSMQKKYDLLVPDYLVIGVGSWIINCYVHSENLQKEEKEEKIQEYITDQ